MFIPIDSCTYFDLLYYQVEKKKLLHVFLKQFIDVYKNWEPVGCGQLPEASSTNDPSADYLLRIDDIVVGCSAGHPAEIILILIEEVTKLTAVVTECKLAFYFRFFLYVYNEIKIICNNSLTVRL